MKNYSSFLDFTRNYKRTSGIFVPYRGATDVDDAAATALNQNDGLLHTQSIEVDESLVLST